MTTAARWIACFGLMILGCSDQSSIEGSPCPCPEELGYTCCGTGELARCVDKRRENACGSGTRFVKIGIGRAHACGLRENGKISCIGANDRGQATPPDGEFTTLVTGADHNCANRVPRNPSDPDGVVVCWGDDSYGQSTPPLGRIQVGAATMTATCGNSLEFYEGVYAPVCWGNSGGEAGLAADRYLQPSTGGFNHICGLSLNYGHPVCSGDNRHGQSEWRPLTAHTKIFAAGFYTCAASAFSPPECWGLNDAGQTNPPAIISTDLALAPGHGCLLDENHRIVCWGTGWNDSISTPPEGEFAKIFAGDYRTCAIPVDETKPAICWGATYEPWY